MKKVDDCVRGAAKHSKLIGMCALLAAALFGLIFNAANFENTDGFMPVVGNLIFLIFDLAFLCAIPLLYLLKKENFLKPVFVIVFTYWFISKIYGFLQSSAWVVDGAEIAGAIGFFEFFIALMLIAVLVFAVLYEIKKEKKFLQIGFCILCGSLFFFFLNWILYIAAYAKYDGNWTSYFNDFKNNLFMPVGIIFAALYILKDCLVKEPEAISEPVGNEEPIAEETVAEETPAEEPVVEGPIVEEAPAAEETVEEETVVTEEQPEEKATYTITLEKEEAAEEAPANDAE